MNKKWYYKVLDWVLAIAFVIGYLISIKDAFIKVDYNEYGRDSVGWLPTLVVCALGLFISWYVSSLPYVKYGKSTEAFSKSVFVFCYWLCLVIAAAVNIVISRHTSWTVTVGYLYRVIYHGTIFIVLGIILAFQEKRYDREREERNAAEN